MINSFRHAAITAAFVASTGLCASAAAQALALSYTLDPLTVSALPKVALPVDRCAGLSWAASIAVACLPEAWRRPATRGAAEAGSTLAASDAAAPATSRAQDSVQGGVFAIALPALGAEAADASRLRIASGNDPTMGSKNPDVLFRFASRYRLKSADEGWEVYRFKDVTSENRTQGTGLKGLALELLVPFQ